MVEPAREEERAQEGGVGEGEAGTGKERNECEREEGVGHTGTRLGFWAGGGAKGGGGGLCGDKSG